MKELNEFDKKCLLKAIDVAKETFNEGNFPVGAILCMDNKIISAGGNEMKNKKSYICHAENMLIIKNGFKLFSITFQ